MAWEVGEQTLNKKFENINQEILDTKGFIDEKKAKILLYKFLYENPTFTMNLIAGVNLLPFQHIMIKTMMQSDYTLAIVSRGGGKSWASAVFAVLDATFNQGVKIGILSRSYRQAKMIFAYIEKIVSSPKASLLSQCVGKITRGNDGCSIRIGESEIMALPLGDGEKLRGFRFQRMIIDELLLMPEKVLNEVIMPFLSVATNPTERIARHELETKLIKAGKMTEEERYKWPNNKIIGLSSASYQFEYLYTLYKQYQDLILKPDKESKAHRAILHFSYEALPEQLYEGNAIENAKAIMSAAQFDREYRSFFTDDSSGYFKVSKMEACTIKDGYGQCVEVAKDKKSEYIISFDPSWSESDGSDDFSMQVIKLSPNERKGTVVHSYTMSGTRLKDHIFYFCYLFEAFSPVMIIGDYNGGVSFISSCNESELFKSKGIFLDCFDADFDNISEYESALRDARNQYNLTTKKIVHLRKPTSQWIRAANEQLQAAFDHKRIYFAGLALDDDTNKDFTAQRSKNIPIADLKYSRLDEEKDLTAKMIDFLETLKVNIDKIKVQCATIEVVTTAQGNQSFDLPSNLKKQRGPNKARKDSYSTIVLGNWMMNTYYDMMSAPKVTVQTSFTPRFIN